MQLVAHTPRPSSGDDGPVFERLLATLSSKFAALHLDDLAQALPAAMAEICVTLNVDRSTVIEFGEEGQRRSCHSAARPDTDAGVSDVDPDELRWLTRRLVDRHPVVISRLEDLPMEAQSEREYGRRSGLSATLAMPVSIGDRSTCALVLGSAQRFRDWHGPIQHRARLLAEIIGSALQRARQEAALRSSLAEIQRLNSRLTADNVCLKEDIKTFHDFDEIVGESAVMRDALERLAQVAPLNCSVLLLGETGTGKELFARAVHERSRRRSRALVRVNCAALPPSLIESELFGHEKGAFTGAFNLRQGRFELADGGTIFLDEIGDLPLDMQGKLLRVLQEGEFERVGSSRTRKVDVRVIAATHHDLEAGIAKGTFRADLYLPTERVSDQRSGAARSARGHRFADVVLHPPSSARAGPPHHQDSQPGAVVADPARLAGERARVGERHRARPDSLVRRHAAARCASRRQAAHRQTGLTARHPRRSAARPYRTRVESVWLADQRPRQRG